MHFEVSFPLTLNFNRHSKITFYYKDNKQKLVFDEGMYYFDGDNGSGKSSFLSMITLLAGKIGKKSDDKITYVISENEKYPYNTFDSFKAAEIREKHFCIISQEIFFLPGLNLCQNYYALNNYNNNCKFMKLSCQNNCPLNHSGIKFDEMPCFLSGGQQQQSFMNIVFDKNKSVWFLDEPFNNMDKNNKKRFWEKLQEVCSEPSKIMFLIDHGMSDEAEAKKSKLFKWNEVIRAKTKNNSNENTFDIKVYKIKETRKFIDEQIHNIAGLKSGKKHEKIM